MKKSFLVLSALLTLVVSGICLQSCSSEYEEYTTEEYGYYTEEEIAAMKAIAEKYNTTIEVDENYYGKKASLAEFEGALIQLVNLPGNYQLVELEEGKGYSFVKKSADISRAKARVAELGNTGTVIVGSVRPRRSDNQKELDENCTFQLSWSLPIGSHKGTASLSVNAPYQLYGNSNLPSAEVTPYYVSVFENVTVYYYGWHCGRYCISGTHRADGQSRIQITKVPEDWSGENASEDDTEEGGN